MAGVDNPRFPHWCRIWRIVGETSMREGEEVLLYEGECRKYTGYRPTEPDGVEKEIYALSLPLVYRFIDADEATYKADRIHEGDWVEIHDRLGVWKGTVKSIMAGNLGTTIHWEDVKR